MTRSLVFKSHEGREVPERAPDDCRDLDFNIIIIDTRNSKLESPILWIYF
jgi:hypothetical protein